MPDGCTETRLRPLSRYCRDYWGIARSTAYQRIDSGESFEHLSAVADIPKPTSEFQLRSLAGLTPEEKVQVWKAAAASAPNGKLSAKRIMAARISLGLGKLRNPVRKPNGLTIDVEAVAFPMGDCYGDPESVWTQLKETLERVRRAWPEGRQTDLHDRLRHYLILTWPQKYAAAGAALAKAVPKATNKG